MPATGVEPVREYKSRRILSPVRLPIPPRRQISGTNRARTYDPLLVRQMLSQLSYDPKILIYKLFTNKTTRMGFEPTTSAVTGRRSNQLSHQAIFKGMYLQNFTQKEVSSKAYLLETSKDKSSTY